MRGLLVVLSGPSGSGKGTVRGELLRRRTDVRYAVSATTRAPRPGEVDGVDYFFLSRSEFAAKIEDGSLLEWANVYGNMYGTLRRPMESWLGSGHIVMVEKDVAGAMTLMERYPEAVYVFIVPPSIAELRQRLVKRRTDSRPTVERRLAAVSYELAQVRRYDYLIINRELDDAVTRLEAVIAAELCRPWRQTFPDDIMESDVNA